MGRRRGVRQVGKSEKMSGKTNDSVMYEWVMYICVVLSEGRKSGEIQMKKTK